MYLHVVNVFTTNHKCKCIYNKPYSIVPCRIWSLKDKKFS